ncbi:Rad17-domain-containing protein [Mycena sanguinolenta]|uniref:Rad17-domain-containing protein n=1 Tax=Mycena sanguinolenta TaxID=230812 RepID=A0A8H7DLF9_9AGAR|nr:Rad17-domain-containing protein [Mycena sanguinolenta]
MPPKSSQATTSKTKPSKKTKAPTSKVTTVKLDVAPSNSPRINPLTAFANTPPSFTATPKTSQASQSQKSKGKGKEKELLISVVDAEDDRLWVDIYEPTTEAELAVHVKKVQDVRRWFDEALVGGPAGKLRKYRRILALTGPAGTAKTATIRVLARELDCELLEWRNAMVESTSNLFDDGEHQVYNSDQESLLSKFEAFLTRASTCQPIFTDTERDTKLSSSQSSSSTARPAARKRQIILLEDLPNILHANTQSRFHAALQSLVMSSSVNPVPIVIIVSDAGIRGEASDERLANGSWGKDRDGVLDIRTVLPKDLLHGPYVTQIAFNPIAPTLMKKALQALISTHFSSSKSSKSAPSKEMLDIIIETSNGDIRSAIMALQFSCVVEVRGTGKGRKKPSASGSKLVLEAVTRREQSLHLFHLIGKVLYNKRKGDPPNPSASAKDIQKDKDLDATLKDPPNLPSHLSEHTRRTSRVNVDLLYADSPIDSSLFSLYIHQNYTQFCNQVEECDGVADWLSWVDSSGGEAWYQANPHRFHLLTMGTLHSLPTPVPRRSQKLFKPEFFDYLTKEKDAWDAVRDVRGWIVEDATLKANEGWRLGGWSRAEVATGLGAVLKARDVKQAQPQAPVSHRLFSSLIYGSGENRGLHQLGEGDLPSDSVDIPEDDGGRAGWSEIPDVQEGGGWLESDDIEDC